MMTEATQMNANKIEELEAKIKNISKEIAALKSTCKCEEIDWNDPVWIDRLIEVRQDEDQEENGDDCWFGPVALKQYNGEQVNAPFECVTGYWQQARPYTGPTRPNWIEWKGGKCPVGRDEFVNVMFANGGFYGGKALILTWGMCADPLNNIIKYSVVLP